MKLVEQVMYKIGGFECEFGTSVVMDEEADEEREEQRGHDSNTLSFPQKWPQKVYVIFQRKGVHPMERRNLRGRIPVPSAEVIMIAFGESPKQYPNGAVPIL